MHVDLHLHLLPGIDDGPPDERAALVGHPDYPVDPATVADRTRVLQAAIDAAGIPDSLEHAWRSPHERRVRAAIDAARQRAR